MAVTYKFYTDAEGRTFFAEAGSDRETELLSNPNLTEIAALSQTTSADGTTVETPTVHTHTESDITDLDKYTQAEVDASQAVQDTAIAVNLAATTTNATNISQEITDRTAADTDLDTRKADKTTQVIAGAGLAGGGDLSSDKTIDVTTKESIEVDADAVHLVNDVVAPMPRQYYGTDSTGTRGWHNDRSSFICESGRFYSYTDGRWVTESDDLYGRNQFQFTENAGTGDTPLYEWEHLGTILPAGTNIKNLRMVARMNNNTTSDWRIIVVVRYPTNPLGWQSGIDNDGEMTNDVIYDDTWRNSVGTFTGNMNDIHLGKMDIDHVLAQDAMVSIYLDPVQENTTTRFFYATWTWEIQ